MSMLFVVDVLDVIIPTRPTISALVTLSRSRTREALSSRTAGWQTKFTSQLGRWFTVHHISRQSNNKIVRFTVQLHPLTNEAIFPCRQPKFDMRQPSCHFGNLLQMPNALNVAAVVPAKKTTLFTLANHEDHHVNPITSFDSF